MNLENRVSKLEQEFTEQARQVFLVTPEEFACLFMTRKMNSELAARYEKLPLEVRQMIPCRAAALEIGVALHRDDEAGNKATEYAHQADEIYQRMGL